MAKPPHRVGPARAERPPAEPAQACRSLAGQQQFLNTLFLVMALLFFLGIQVTIAQQPVVADPSKGTPADAGHSVAGSWAIDLWTAYQKTSMELRLKQTGSEVTGTYDLKGTTGSYYDIPVKGTLTGNALFLKTNFRTHQYIQATVGEDGKSMEGTFMTSVPNQLKGQKK